MKKLLFLTFLFCGLSPSLFGESLTDISWEDCQVRHMLPDLVSVPAVEFAIPHNYDCVPLSEIFGRQEKEGIEGYFWGPKQAIIDAFKNFESGVFTDFKPSVPLISAQIAHEVVQMDEDSFVGEDNLKKIPNLKYKKLKWGNHPILVIDQKVGENQIHLAYVGLNYYSNVLRLSFYPGQDSEEKNLAFWETFLTETKPLEILEKCKSKGHELKEGVTVVNLAGSFLKIIAEQRKSDREFQVVIIPCSEGISFEKEEVSSMLASETLLEDLFDGKFVKLVGTITTDGPSVKYHIVSRQTIHIMAKQVDDFTLNKDLLVNKNIEFLSFKDIQ